ncbi:uncharacterized protein Triagg1_8761 [Trichoderma aggressivum f. europaeum]|uniref:Uncharacterized protein n=1 Tax=Trichoderma aggressivum f. europaeum TaxID=173218 RepID=A0AAE1I9F9_9HYPO|nr:hypothetical protein Triagg1_8761 [Trichoderma aggressivum f. europaeum]
MPLNRIIIVIIRQLKGGGAGVWKLRSPALGLAGPFAQPPVTSTSTLTLTLTFSHCPCHWKRLVAAITDTWLGLLPTNHADATALGKAPALVVAIRYRAVGDGAAARVRWISGAPPAALVPVATELQVGDR